MESSVKLNRKINNPCWEEHVRFICPECGKASITQQEWQNHLNVRHNYASKTIEELGFKQINNKYHECQICTKWIADTHQEMSPLQYHHFLHLPFPGTYRCKYCPYSFTLKNALCEHLYKYHNSLIHVTYVEGDKDPTLNQSFEELDIEIDSNMEWNINKNAMECQLDDEEFEQICNEMFEPIEESCNNQGNELDTPNKKRFKLDLPIATNNIEINNSLQGELQKYVHYLCPECGYKFESQSMWRTHVFEQHDLANAVDTNFRAFNAQKTEYICLICYQVQRTANHSELRRHHFLHMPYQAYLKCAICTKTKSSKPKMLQHLKYTHLKQIQENMVDIITPTKTISNNSYSFDCDKLYDQQIKFDPHCQQYQQRLKPLLGGQYDIEKNKKLLEHLKRGSKRIAKLLQEDGIDIYSIKLPYK